MQPETQTKAVAQIPRWQEFEGELRVREAELATLLPSHISRERFINMAIIAAKNNQDLVRCDRRSLHAAVTKAAEDGLQPDGREGVINVYKGQACWIPMTHGIRKRAREICGMIIDAQVVHEHDFFEHQQGDDPKIIHKPPPLGTPRGKMIGAYAIFKQNGEILHREVMDAEQIAKVKSCVKAQNGLLWTTFEDQAWRKTVVRRGIKTVPSVPDALQRIVSRDDDQYEFVPNGDGPKRAALLDIPDIPDVPAIADATQDEPSPEHIPDEIGYLEHFEAEMREAGADAELRHEIWDGNVHMLERLSPYGQRRMKKLQPVAEAAE